MGFYDRHVLPRLIQAACSQTDIAARRLQIVPQAKGVVLELGFGTGLNLPFYDPAKVERVLGVEPSEGMLARARAAAEAFGTPVEVLPEPAETLSVPSGSVDTVVVTYSLCTIPDPQSALEAARRALKPGGRLLFCEHGLAPDAKVQRWQRTLEPVWKRIAGGCHLSRDIPEILEAAGFAVERLGVGYRARSPKWAGYDYWGAARPR